MFDINTNIDSFNYYLMKQDNLILYNTYKRALLYILGKCVAINDSEGALLKDSGDIIALDTTNKMFKIYLKLDFIDYITDQDYEKHYTLHAIYGMNDVELVHMVWMEEDKIKFTFKVLSNDIKDFTDEQKFLVNAILENYINSSSDEDETVHDLFYSMIVSNEENGEDDDS